MYEEQIVNKTRKEDGKKMIDNSGAFFSAIWTMWVLYLFREFTTNLWVTLETSNSPNKLNNNISNSVINISY